MCVLTADGYNWIFNKASKFMNYAAENSKNLFIIVLLKTENCHEVKCTTYQKLYT